MNGNVKLAQISSHLVIGSWRKGWIGTFGENDFQDGSDISNICPVRPGCPDSPRLSRSTVVDGRLFFQGTIEERIKDLQRSKLDLAENILSKNGAGVGLESSSKLSLQDLKLLFGVGGATFSWYGSDVAS